MNKKQKDKLNKKAKILRVFKDNCINNITPSEQYFLDLLNKLKQSLIPDLSFQFQKGWIAGNGFYISDFYFPVTKLTVEIDGGYHSTGIQKKKDVKKEKYLLERGVKTIRIKNHEVLSLNMQKIIDFLVKNAIIIV